MYRAFPEFLAKYSRIIKYFIPCFGRNEAKEGVSSTTSTSAFPAWCICTVSAEADNWIKIANDVIVLKAREHNP